MNNLDRLFTKDPTEFAHRYLDYVSRVLKEIDHESIARFISVLLEARKRGVTIFFVGNGGSAATASHFANDLAVGTNSFEIPFRAVSLTDNQAIITALANDFGYEEVFVRQLQVLGRQGDILVGISASGNSPNVVRAFEYAEKVGIKTVAITAFDGGKMRQIATDGIHVPTALKEYGPAEDAHMILDHLVAAYLIRIVQHEASAI
jgi:D-sedoheptulose 7-phosphate isomerase